MADYWMKLYIEILDDPKMAVLPDRIWRRVIELFLVAKKLGKDGKLPGTRQIAWLLRMNPEELDLDMEQIQRTGIIEKTLEGWYIPKFTERQGPSSTAERVRQHRERKEKQQYYGNETPEKRNVTQNTEDRIQNTETNTEGIPVGGSRDDDFGKLCTAYEQDIGVLTPTLAQELGDDLDDYGLALCLDAIQEAVGQNVRKWRYVQGIMRNWKTTGRASKPTNGNHKKREPVQIVLSDGTVTEATT